jgi:hypothetical protein
MQGLKIARLSGLQTRKLNTEGGMNDIFEEND